MARQLWLLRHAEAEPHGARPDSERRLTERGEQQARTAGLALLRMGVTFDAILFSPKQRARQTAELAMESFPEEERERMGEHPPLAGDFDAARAIEALAQAASDGRVLLVGHEPDFSGVVAELTGGRIDLKKGGVAVVRLDGGASAELVILLRPRELGLIAGVPGGGD
jgi:phosphohistidine phosphatase